VAKVADDDLFEDEPEEVEEPLDPLHLPRYSGFVSVAAVTVYELAIKEIFFSFADRKHKILGEVVKHQFERINGRIKYRELKEEYLPRFGEKYQAKFIKKKNALEAFHLRHDRLSVVTCYNNVVEWRNSFAHEGRLPTHVTYEEAKRSYSFGKKLIDCLATTMVR
jgi:hypothetical protein